MTIDTFSSAPGATETFGRASRPKDADRHKPFTGRSWRRPESCAGVPAPALRIRRTRGRGRLSREVICAAQARKNLGLLTYTTLISMILNVPIHTWVRCLLSVDFPLGASQGCKLAETRERFGCNTESPQCGAG